MDHAQNRPRTCVVRVASNGDVGLDLGILLPEEGVECLDGLICHCGTT